MAAQVFEVEKDRFDLVDPNKYYLQGSWPKEHDVLAVLDGQELETEHSEPERVSALERFKDLDAVDSVRMVVTVHLPENLSSYKKLKVYAVSGGKKILWFSTPVSRLRLYQGAPQFFIESVDVEEGMCRVRGWVADLPAEQVWIEDKKKDRIDAEFQWQNRVDVVNQFSEKTIEGKCGFFIEFPVAGRSEAILVFATSKKFCHKLHLTKTARAMEKMGDYWQKGMRYLKLQGPAVLAGKVFGKLTNKNKAPMPYSKWYPKSLPSQADLEAQRKATFPEMPMISVVVPLYKTPEPYLNALVKSLEDQTYANWQLCLSDGSGADSPLTSLLAGYTAKDARVKVVSHESPLHIAENTNAAIAIADGDFIAFADHDDVLEPFALYEMVKKYNEHPDALVLYSDEDKMSMDGHKFFQPHFKPDFNIDLLTTVNYICHLFLTKKSLLDQVGLLNPEYDGAQDYDLILRLCEAAGNARIQHVAKILYHWRSHENSTSENPESKMYAFDAGERAIQAHYDRLGIDATVTKGEYLGLYRTRYSLKEQPLISIIIPNKDHIDDLKRCVDSIMDRASYRNFEFIIVENNSTEESTFQYYKELEAAHDNVHVVYWKGIFNYSAINNFGAEYAKGDYFLLLNNDTEIINEDCLEELLGYCTREDVGAVGARLYYDDDTVQHAGVVVGFGGIAGHCFVQQKRGVTGYMHRIICACDYSAVTAACMMVKRKAFEEVGGLSEELQVAFNDIDFCMQLRKAGYQIVYNPYAELYHYESKSRGLEDTPEKVARFNREIETFEKRWPEILRDGDPFYNPNLTLDSQDFSLKRI